MPTITFTNLKDEKKQRIVDAALKEFAAHDFEHVNIQNIIKDAKISRGSFYQYFSDLEDLFNYLVKTITITKKAYFDKHQVLHSEAPFFDRIGELYRLGYQFALENVLIFKAGKHMIKRLSTSNNDTIMTNKKWLNTYYSAEIQKDIDKGIIRNDVDINMLIDVLTLFLDELSTLHYIEQRMTQTEVDQRFKRFIKLLKKGLE